MIRADRITNWSLIIQLVSARVQLEPRVPDAKSHI